MIELLEGPKIEASWKPVTIGEFTHYEQSFDYIKPRQPKSKFIMNVPDMPGAGILCLMMNMDNKSDFIWRVR